MAERHRGLKITAVAVTALGAAVTFEGYHKLTETTAVLNPTVFRVSDLQPEKIQLQGCLTGTDIRGKKIITTLNSDGTMVEGKIYADGKKHSTRYIPRNLSTDVTVAFVGGAQEFKHRKVNCGPVVPYTTPVIDAYGDTVPLYFMHEGSLIQKNSEGPTHPHYKVIYERLF